MNWPVIKLAKLCHKITDGSHNPPAGVAKSDFMMISSKNIFDDQINFDNPRYLSEEDFISENKRTNISENDILLTIVGTVGRVAVVDKNHPNFTLQRSVAVLKPQTDKITPRFLMYSLRSTADILTASSRGVAQKGIYLKQLQDLDISVPPLEEQKRITGILDKADAIRRKRQQAIKLADEFLRAVFLDMFGEPVTNPKGWEVKQLKDIVSKIGSGSTPTGGKESYLSEGISLIRSLNIHDNEFRYKDLAFISDQQAKKLANVIVEKNDVLLNITGASVCRCAIVPENVLPARVNQHVAIIRTKSMNPIYLMHLLISKSYKNKLLLLASSGATREALTKEQIENLEVPCPPNDLQNRFQEIESKVSEFTKRLDIFTGDELFNSLSQNAFSE